ncbi:MAG: pentapeptide repeat-containing protein [Nitrospinales bacterium]
MIRERKERQFDESQYEILIMCSKNGELAQWNEWRENNQKVSIYLEGANFLGANLAGADLSEANLAGTNLGKINLEGADLWKANLKSTNLCNANLKGVELISADLTDADLRNVNLAGADLWKANLKGAKLIAAKVDRQTFIWGCDFDKQTVFNGKELCLARIEPRLKKILQ